MVTEHDIQVSWDPRPVFFERKSCEQLLDEFAARTGVEIRFFAPPPRRRPAVRIVLGLVAFIAASAALYHWIF